MQAPTIYGSAPLPLRVPHPVLDVGTCYPFTITKNFVVWFTGDPSHRLFPTAGTAPTEVREIVPASGRTMSTTVVWASRCSPGVASCLFPHLPSAPVAGYGYPPLPFVWTKGRIFWFDVSTKPRLGFRPLRPGTDAYRMLDEAGALTDATRGLIRAGHVTYTARFSLLGYHGDDILPPRVAPKEEEKEEGPNAPTVDAAKAARLEAEARKADVEQIGKALLEEARERGWCEEFDEFVARVNEHLTFPLPARERDLRVSVSFGFDHTVPAGQVIGLTGRVRDAIRDALRSLDVATDGLDIDVEIIEDTPAW